MVSFINSALLALVAGSPVIVERDLTTYGQGQDVAIDAPGIPYHPAYKGFPSGGQGPRQTHGIAAAIGNYLHPGWVPQGVNPVQCTPKDGQPPVVLIPATTGTAYLSWAYIGPELAKLGLCVYSFNHSPLVVGGHAIPGTGFMGNMTESAEALGVFVDEVLALTGAEKVDFVGHSQGAGAVPFYYLKYIMEGLKVRKTIGLAPSVGTEFHGMNLMVHLLLSQSEEVKANEIIGLAANAECLDQQLTDSDWMKHLHEGGLAIDGVEYVNIATKFDQVLVPYTNCNFEEPGKNITNYVLQDECALDFCEHIELPYSPNVFQIVKNSLFGTNNPIHCSLKLPFPL